MRSIRTSAQLQPQSTSRILMVRPVHFAFNEQTATSNEFQDAAFARAHESTAQEQAREEFDHLVSQLDSHGVELYVFDDTPTPHTPDSIFPNNWVSFHQSGKIVLYPMMAPNRRDERRLDIIDELRKTFHVEEIIDLTYFEQQEKYLEGTGSMVLDRRYKIAYACLSPRTHPEVLDAFAEATGYEIVRFEATDENGQAIYHTNVLMCVGDIFAAVCLEAIRNPDERHLVRSVLEETGKYIVELTMEQVRQMAGNMLMVRNKKGEKLLVMSTQAYESLTPQQRDALDDYAELFHADLSMIEGNGGGSARCMLAEIHLPPK
ncbi:hypothetical protein HNQ92_001983 [Rhabdobacter roseus]|uniref:Amidinotransferase n=1 Tax=Rhabdobacter roseus TaxID=1655419 RepID=A0A840TQ68_9BACT|nr:arginine deiminase-related protein [Rhabdobacter roseus]MBB5283857.1 hypothetical protein [Rhabdobacter roseus]